MIYQDGRSSSDVLTELKIFKKLNEKEYTWEQINQTFMNLGIGPKIIVRFMFELNKIHNKEGK